LYLWNTSKSLNNKQYTFNKQFWIKNCSVYLFRAALYMLIIVLNEDALFNFLFTFANFEFMWMLLSAFIMSMNQTHYDNKTHLQEILWGPGLLVKNRLTDRQFVDTVQSVLLVQQWRHQSFVLAKYQSPKCLSAKCQSARCQLAKCESAKCQLSKCESAKCQSAKS
jgi:hypothetical protein